jgi:DNA modification methylase
MNVDLRHGDCVELMRGIPDNSVDSVVTDPPYEYSFMGKTWDGAGIAYSLEMWGEALRVLKPGGHLLAFGGTRTYHRMACAIEDAGFEIRDSIHWVYGSGFPKSLNIGKAIDKANGRKFEDRYALGRHIRQRRESAGISRNEIDGWFGYSDGCSHWERQDAHGARVPSVADFTVLKKRLNLSDEWDELVARVEAEREVVGTARGGIVPDPNKPKPFTVGGHTQDYDVTLAATPEALRWEGWGTALKPAHEPIVVARKPLSGTVAGNVLVWGTGGLNIDGCRVGTDDRFGGGSNGTSGFVQGYESGDGWQPGSPSGRWPANVVFDRTAGEALDQQSGTGKSPSLYIKQKAGWLPPASTHETNDLQSAEYGDSGGASRFFTQADFGPDDWPFVYQAKPSRKERNAGLDGLPEKPTGDAASPISNRKCRKCGLVKFAQPHCTCAEPEWEEAKTTANGNYHPTVKPVALMRHLVRLVTPPGGTVLDPFAGSGTTLVAAVLEGFDAIGCEMTDEYLPIIEGRVAWAQAEVEARAEAAANPEQPTLL